MATRGNLRQVKALPEKVYTYQYVKLPDTEVPHDCHSLQCVDIGVEVSGPHAGVQKEIGKVFGETLGQCCYKNPFLSFQDVLYFSEEIFTWFVAGFTSMGGSIRPVGLITCSTICPRARASSYLAGVQRERRSGYSFLEFLKPERSVVQCGGQPEAKLDEGLLSRSIPPIHAHELGMVT